MRVRRARRCQQIVLAALTAGALLAPAVATAAVNQPSRQTCPAYEYFACFFTNTDYSGSVLGFRPTTRGLYVGLEGWDLTPGDRIEVDNLPAPFSKSISSAFNWNWQNQTRWMYHGNVSTKCNLEISMFDGYSLFGRRLDLAYGGMSSMPKGWNDVVRSLEIAWYCTTTALPSPS